MDGVVILITREVAEQWISDRGHFLLLTRLQGEELTKNFSLHPLRVLIGHHPQNATCPQIDQGRLLRGVYLK